MTARVTSAEGVNTAQNTRLNTVETSLDGKASSTALTTLSSRVGTAEANLTAVASTAADASGIAKAIIGFFTDVNGKITGMKSENDGVTSLMEFMADVFRIVSADGSTEFINGIWYTVNSGVRTSWGKVHGASGHGLVWWTGPNSVPRGSESKSNAYVYVSMNTTGGPRFGGSDVPTGGDLTVDSNIGQTKGGNGYAAVSKADGWKTISSATLTNVSIGEMIVAQQSFVSPVRSGTFEARLLADNVDIAYLTPALIAAGQSIDLTTESPKSGSVTFAIQLRVTSTTGSLEAGAGAYSFARMATATASKPGLMSPTQATQLATLWSGGGGGGGR